MPVRSFNGKSPKIDPTTFVAEGATIIGDVEIGADSSVWPSAVLRGDVQARTIGKSVNVQDNATIHTAYKAGTVVGDNVSIGHGAILHGCEVGNNVVIGMGAIILDASKIGDWVLVGAGAIVPPEHTISSGSLVLGVPGKAVRQLGEEDLNYIETNARYYVELAKRYRRLGQI